MYTAKDFPTKVSVKRAIEAGEEITVFPPGPFGTSKRDGEVALEGPHFPKPHTWYGLGTLVDGLLVKIK